MALTTKHLVHIESVVQQVAERLLNEAKSFDDSPAPEVRAHARSLEQAAEACKLAANIVISASVSWDSLGPILRRNHQWLTAEQARMKADRDAARPSEAA